MRKAASVLAFLLAAGLLVTWFAMKQTEANQAADRIKTAFAEMDTDRAAFEQDMRESREHRSNELLIGLGGIVALIAGLALWPYGQRRAVYAEQSAQQSAPPPDRRCPYCAETIKHYAIRCRFCGSSLETEPSGFAPSPYV